LVLVYATTGQLIAAPTPEHPFFVNNTYKPAKDLVVGDTLLTYTGKTLVVGRISTKDTTLSVYNFEVQDTHNYLVGEDGVLVHNSCWNLRDFVDNFSLQQKLDYVSDAWSKYYPEIFDARKFLEDLMGHYKFTAAKGWVQTYNSFPTIDFYQASTKIAVSMKTTITTNVNTFLSGAAVRNNINALIDAKTRGTIINGQTSYKIERVQMHIYLPKEKFTIMLANSWKEELKRQYPQIDFVIDTIEQHINK
jgi:hypothetical protein